MSSHRERRNLWVEREPYRRGNGETDPGIEMRFHDDWWHFIFSGPTGHRVLLGPIGIDLGTFETIEDAKARAEANARERSLNSLAAARDAMRRAEIVLGALTS